MRPFQIVAALIGAAAFVAVAANVLDRTGVQDGATIVTTLALTGYVAFWCRTAQRSTRLALIIFCVLFTAAGVVELAGHLSSFPIDVPMGPNGCPTATHDDYWRGQLRHQQAAAILRCAAFVAATRAVYVQFHLNRRRLEPARFAVLLVLILVALIWFRPITSVAEDLGRVTAAAPGLLSLLAATILTALGASRRLRDRSAGWLLAGSTIPILFSELNATERMASLYWQIPRPPPTDERVTAFRGCLFSTAEPVPTPLPEIVGSAIFAVIVLAAPALMVWSILHHDESEPPTTHRETPDQT